MSVLLKGSNECQTSKTWRAGLRFISNTVTFTTIDRSVPNSKRAEAKKTGRLRVPLLKSPSHFGHFSSRINRIYNEDKYSAFVLELPEKRTVFNFSVFDGHGGDQCSTFLSENLSKGIEESNELSDPKADNKREELLKLYSKNIGGYWRRWYRQRYSHIKQMEESTEKLKLVNLKVKDDDYSLRLPFSFLNTDYGFFKQEDNKSGSTCTSAFFETIYAESGTMRPVEEDYYFHRKTISRLTIAHVGDTKAILADKNGEARPLTRSHHPSNPEEALRLRKLAANFFMTDSYGEERFISLANTRAFGDIDFKQMGVTAEPDVSQFIIGESSTISKILTPDEIKKHTIGSLGGDEGFLVLCSDGVTDVLTDQEIVDIIMSHFNMKGNNVATPQSAAEEVIKFVEYVGGDDNATCLVVKLNGWGHWPIIDRTGALRQARMDDYNPRSRG